MMKPVKLIVSLLMSALMLFTMIACSAGNVNDEQEPAESSAQQSSSPAAETTAPDGEQTAAQDNSVIKIALAKNVDILDGIECNSATFLMVFEIFDTLTKLAEDGSLLPCLATEWEQVDDYNWHFTLRDDVKFSDGSAFNAESAAYTLNYIVNKETSYKYKAKWSIAWPITATADGEYSLTVTTSSPCFETPGLLSRVAMWPMNAADNYEEFVKNPIGTGPYMLESWVLGESIDLVVNPTYWGEAPIIQRIEYDILTDSTARTVAVQSGEYDMVLGLNYDDAQGMENGTMTTPGLKFATAASTGMQYLFFSGRSDNPFIQNADFRKAMTYAIDHEGILSQLLYNYCEGAHGVTTTTAGLANVYVSEGYPAYDPEKAMELAKACGYNGEEIVLYYIPGQFTNDLEITELIVSQLIAAGFNVTMQEIDSASWSTIRPSSDYDIALNSCSGSFTGQPTDYITQVLANSSGWKWADVDALVEKCYSEGTTEEEFGQYMVEALELCWNEMPYLWAAENTFLYAVDPALTDYEYLTTGYIRLEHASFK